MKGTATFAALFGSLVIISLLDLAIREQNGHTYEEPFELVMGTGQDVFIPLKTNDEPGHKCFANSSTFARFKQPAIQCLMRP